MSGGSASVEGLSLAVREGAVRFGVRVKPRAARDGVGGVREGALEVSVTAPPVDGEANAAVVQVLARALGVGRRDVTIVTGESGRQKVVEVAGLSVDDARRRLAGGAP